MHKVSSASGSVTSSARHLSNCTVTTLNKQKALLVPVSAPILYQRKADFSGDAFGELPPSHKLHARYNELLQETVEQGYARLIGP